MCKRLIIPIFIPFLIELSRLGAVAQPKDWQPVDYVKAVADRCLERAQFKFRLIPYKPDKKFGGIEFINFDRNFSAADLAVAYALTVVTSDREVDIPVEVSHNDGIQIWLNDRLVYEKAGKKAAKVVELERSVALEEKFTAHFQQGDNKLLIKSETQGNAWKVYLQPLPESKASLQFAPDHLPGVSAEVASLSNWLIIGPFSKRLSESSAPEKEFVAGKVYENQGKRISWSVPRTEMVTDVYGANPLFGSLVDYNYHTAGVAWAIGHLGQFTGEKKYLDYLSHYCNFMLESVPTIAFEKYDLGRYSSKHAFLIDKPLLDFTTAPALPFLYRLQTEETFENRESYEAFVANIQDYVRKRQLRLEDGTLARETPFKYSIWSDDMFMGIPFLLHSGLYTKDPEQRKAFLDDAARQVTGFSKRVFDPAKNLFVHAHYTANPELKLPYWARANGWAIWATSEVLLHLPKNHRLYKDVLALYRKHVDGLVKTQDKSGFYKNLLTDAQSEVETSGTAIITMAIARGLNQGWLDKRKYTSYAVNGWKALTTVIDEQGKVSNIIIGTMSSEDPDYYRKQPVAEDDSHGLLGLIFAGIEMQKLLPESKD